MRKRFVVRRVEIRTKDWLGREQSPQRIVTYLCKPGMVEEYSEIVGKVQYRPQVWNTNPKHIRYFKDEKSAEKAAFSLVASDPALYMGWLSVVRLSLLNEPIKARRKGAPERDQNKGRWPNSTGRKR